MIITGIEAFPVTNPTPYIGGPVWLFVGLDTDKGIRGYGEILAVQSCLRPRTLARIIEEVGQDFFVGQDVANLEYLFHKYYNSFYSHNGDLLKTAIYSGIEMACVDALGKELDRPAHALLGGRFRPNVRTYTYISAPPSKAALGFDFWLNPDLVAERAGELVEQGFTALKLDPFPLLTGSTQHQNQVVPLQWSLEALDLTEATIGGIRKRVGSRADIIIGTHGQMTASSAIRVARRLERFDPLWLEEPVPPELASEMAKVARGTTIPITTGERLSTKWEFARLIKEEAAAIFNLDVSQVGGLWEAKKIAAMAEASYIQIAPHVYGGPLVAAASIQLALASPNFLICEGLGKFEGVHADLLDEPILWKDGAVVPSDRPGLGHNLNEKVARELAARDDDRLWGSIDSTAP
ncbi:L-alanine-DL-glutamate epimerase [Arboricoccus pini]|uniref:L-alanine-DL-glutamate epimerase n=1 Tax=Arboricoccus pini TaxID=1963835 RepID=A0A212RUU1_9PROT|nr:mandelate racemase/muconate lactonizing enzyme family protein [Arboricoccus pini]SNB76395.1 L-alanine-DL-glutamate epimerase [Arboricoccus pini]